MSYSLLAYAYAMAEIQQDTEFGSAPRYWVIAPVESKPAELFDKVWQFDLANGLISIGWDALGDVSKMSREGLSKFVAAAYPDKPSSARTLIANMIWPFWNEITPGDFVIARRGQKTLVGVGRVVRAAFYAPGHNPFLAAASYCHHGFIGVEWQEQPRNTKFHDVVFPRRTLKAISKVDYLDFVKAGDYPSSAPATSELANASAIDDLGTDTPDRARSERWTYARDPKVREAVLQRANGKCELCCIAGFEKPDGKAYLEAHHIIALAHEGEDRLTNVIALCPNDHREAHFGKRAKEIEKKMQQKLKIITSSGKKTKS